MSTEMDTFYIVQTFIFQMRNDDGDGKGRRVVAKVTIQQGKQHCVSPHLDKCFRYNVYSSSLQSRLRLHSSAANVHCWPRDVTLHHGMISYRCRVQGVPGHKATPTPTIFYITLDQVYQLLLKFVNAFFSSHYLCWGMSCLYGYPWLSLFQRSQFLLPGW